MNKNGQMMDNMVKLSMENEIAIMSLCNGKQNKLKNPEFLDLAQFQNWMETQKPMGLIICGEGRHFSSGADVDEIIRHKDNLSTLQESIEKGKQILDYIENLPIITVAAISGMCCGGGLELALACQFRIATNVSVFSFPEARLGLVPGLGGTVRTARLIGRGKAIKMIVSGDNYVAEEAEKMGLIDLIVEKKEHIQTAKDFIRKLCEGKDRNHISSILSAISSDSYACETDTFVELVSKI